MDGSLPWPRCSLQPPGQSLPLALAACLTVCPTPGLASKLVLVTPCPKFSLACWAGGREGREERKQSKAVSRGRRPGPRPLAGPDKGPMDRAGLAWQLWIPTGEAEARAGRSNPPPQPRDRDQSERGGWRAEEQEAWTAG